MTQDGKPRITITHERHEELLAVEAEFQDSLIKNTNAGLNAIETIGRLMIRLGRSQRAGRRLAGIHKERASVARQNADCHQHNWRIDRARANDAEERGESLQVRLGEATQLILQSVKVVEDLEAKLTAALKRAREAEAKLDSRGKLFGPKLPSDADVFVDGIKMGHWEAEEAVLDNEWHHVAITYDSSKIDGPPEFYTWDGKRVMVGDKASEKPAEKPPLEDVFSGGGTMTVWVRDWEECYEARKLAEHWRDTWGELNGPVAKNLPWESPIQSTSKSYEEHLAEAREYARYWRDCCGDHAPTFKKFPWEKEDEPTASA